MNENKKSSSIWQFFTIDVNNNTGAVRNICDYKLSCSNNLKSFSMSPMIQHLRAKHPSAKTKEVTTGSGLVCQSVGGVHSIESVPYCTC